LMLDNGQQHMVRRATRTLAEFLWRFLSFPLPWLYKNTKANIKEEKGRESFIANNARCSYLEKTSRRDQMSHDQQGVTRHARMTGGCDGRRNKDQEESR